MKCLRQFAYTLKGFDFYGICEIQTIECLAVMVTCTDLYIEGLGDDNPPDVKDIVDYQLILDIEDMVRIEWTNQ